MRDAIDEKNTPLHMAAWGKDVPTLEAAIRMAPDINARNRFGMTPLHTAVDRANDAMVRCLIDAGADLEAKDCDGHRPLMYALMGSGRPRIAKLLIRAGCDVQTPDPKWKSIPLPFAARINQASVVEAMVKAGADINVFDPNTKMTALMTACLNGYLKTVEKLVRLGADARLAMADGVTAENLCSNAWNHIATTDPSKKGRDMNCIRELVAWRLGQMDAEDLARVVPEAATPVRVRRM